MSRVFELAREYAHKSRCGRINVFIQMSEWAKTMTVQEIEDKLQGMSDSVRTVWTLKEPEVCYIIKETGEIIETTYIDNDYFHAVRKMGNLAVTRERAERIVAERQTTS